MDLPEGFSFDNLLPPKGNRRLSFAEAESVLRERIKEKEKDLRTALFDLVLLYKQAGLPNLALPVARRLVEMASDPDEKAHYWLTMGQIAEQMDDFQAAVEFYRQAFALEPINNDVWYFINNNLGYSLNKLGRYIEGERYCRTAISINTKRHNAYKNLAIALEGQGKYVEAVSNYIQAVKTNADDPRAYLHLQNLLAQHPYLIRDNPSLLFELEDCQNASAGAQHMLRSIIEEYWDWDK